MPSSTTSAHSVYATYPPSSLLNPNLLSNPPTLRPPVSERTFAHPFFINPDVYDSMLHIAWPTTIAILYSASVYYMNGVNKKRDYKPWSFSKTRTFYTLVLAHNILLALYSGWTFAGMLNAIRNSWPGWNGEYGLAGVADALCKLHGPRGPGSAATFNMETETWSISDISMRLLGGVPDATDVGRIWNEGLAFYGWLFYLSKFYEVLDTAIVLTKGKKTSFLQTYHHTGAMFAMWAGIRYMSPPIWMFTFINSGIHTLMYTYYTASALTIRVPQQIKKTLTVLQIFQILFGSTYAFLHLFIAYDVPYYAVYRVMNNLTTALPTAASTASSAMSTAAQSVDFSAWLKKAALRAAGEEGLAENVRNSRGETFGIDAVHAAKVEKAQEQITYKLSMTRTHCLDTSGEVFAIIINLLYLAPLAYMFIAFFARYWTEGSEGDPPKRAALENAKVSAEQARDDVEQKVKEAMEDRQGGDTEPPPQLKSELDDAKDKVDKAAKDLKDATLQKADGVDLKDLRAQAQQKASDAKDMAKDMGQKAKDTISSKSDEGNDKARTSDNATDEGKEDDADEGNKDEGAEEGEEDPTPVKHEDKNEDKEDKNDDDKDVKKDDSDASAYEVNPDLPKTEDEVKAEEEMQPNGR